MRFWGGGSALDRSRWRLTDAIMPRNREECAMQIDVSAQQANVPVTVVKPRGDLDSATYTELIDAVRKVIAEGAKDLVIDLSEVPFLSSAGLMAMHSTALMLRGDRPPELESRGKVL